MKIKKSFKKILNNFGMTEFEHLILILAAFLCGAAIYLVVRFAIGISLGESLSKIFSNTLR